MFIRQKLLQQEATHNTNSIHTSCLQASDLSNFTNFKILDIEIHAKGGVRCLLLFCLIFISALKKFCMHYSSALLCNILMPRIARNYYCS